MQKKTATSAWSEQSKRNRDYTFIKNNSFGEHMTRYVRRKTTDRLHCTYSAIIDIFEMENNREPTTQEVNNIILMVGDRAAIAK